MICPICGTETEKSHRPFCSKRCADLDLAKWLNGSYALPSDNPEDVENALKELGEVGGSPASSSPTQH